MALLLVLLSSGCSNHFVLHSRSVEGIRAWKSEERAGDLLMRLQWASPMTPGPHPAVLVHPEARHSAREMKGIVRSLAREGYVALAVDYQHAPSGDRIFTWTREEDSLAAISVLKSHPQVDPLRVGAMGYSQGGVYSLLIAAETGQVQAVVAYYPVTDFDLWFNDPSRPFLRRQAFRLITRFSEHRMKRVKEQGDGVDFEREAPLEQADQIFAPTLLIHGDADTTVTLTHSQRLFDALDQRGRTVKLVVIPGAEHVFNFRDLQLADEAWRESLSWLNEHLAAD